MKKIICIIMGFVLVFSFSACSSDVTETQETTTVSTTRPEAQSISLSLLNSMINSNIVAAKEEYEGNLYTFLVEVSDIHSSYIEAIVYESTSISYNSFGGVQVLLSNSDISSLRKGDEITVEGYVEIFETYGGNGFKIVDAVVVE